MLTVSASTASIILRKAKRSAREQNKPPLPSPLKKKSHFRSTVTTSTSAPLPIYSCWMALTSIRNSSSRAGVGDIGSMRRGIHYLKGLRRKRERRGKACELLRLRFRRGNGGRDPIDAANRMDPTRGSAGAEICEGKPVLPWEWRKRK